MIKPLLFLIHGVFNTLSERKNWRFGKFLLVWISFVFLKMMRNSSFDLQNGGSTYTRVNTVTLRHGFLVWNSAEDVNSEYQLFHIFRAVFNIYTGKKCSEYLLISFVECTTWKRLDHPKEQDWPKKVLSVISPYVRELFFKNWKFCKAPRTGIHFSLNFPKSS